MCKQIQLVRVAGIALIFLLGLQSAPAQDKPMSPFSPVSDTINNLFGLFESEDLLEITLRFDVSWFMKEKPADEYLDAILTYHFNETDSVNKAIRLRCRGNYRYRTCSFPPIRLNLRNTEGMIYDDLEVLRNVKLVTHCKDNELYEDYMLKEYMIYKLYNIVTDYSFRVRLLKINYVDIGKNNHSITRYGFIIEPLNVLLERINAVEIEDVIISDDYLEPGSIDRIAIFQYMIGNSDWYLPLIHNFKVVKRYDNYTPDVLAIPYDFDYSGFVNTHYALPRDDLGLSNVRERAYIGPCRSDDEYRVFLEEFSGYHARFIETIRDFPYLDRKVRKDLTNYVESFYDLFEKDTIINRFNAACKEK